MLAPSMQDFEFQERSLQAVSRTFALTIPQLPKELRAVVGNAYLLCRIADTIEDEATLSTERQQYFTDYFTRVVEGTALPQQFAAELAPLLSLQMSVAERELVAETPAVIRITHSFNQNQRAAMARCVRIMAQGMAEYQAKESLAGLTNLPDMDQYCYYVAGVVGEMLTELFCDYSPEINAHKASLMRLAVSFGQGLQMTNILKDIWEDRSRGACWLPRDVFAIQGIDLAGLTENYDQPRFAAGLAELISVAKAHLQNALTYTLLLPRSETGIRRFCLWALGMAVLTLRKINKHPGFRNGREVKISRRSVHTTIALTNLLVRNNTLLKLLLYLTSFNLPVTPGRERLVKLVYEPGTQGR
jgi:farnesyl-diphosphate farnesyltransferase